MSKICDTCGLPEELCVCEEIARESQEIRITVDKRRYGKMMTIVDGINPADVDMDKLTKELKSKCACGGTLKDGRVELQGDHKKRVADVLKEMGYNANVT